MIDMQQGSGVATIEIAADQRSIDIWIVLYDQIDDAALAGILDLLSSGEREKHAGFHFADDRKRYVVTRAMVRTVLSRYAAVSPGDWTFATTAFGRPQIADRHGDACRLSFNISHTRGLIAMAVARERALGVDVEHLASRRMSMEIAKRFFSPAEVSDLTRIPVHRQRDRFFAYWTLKESYLKALGKGLSIPLDRFGFQFQDEGAVRLKVDPGLDRNANCWQFWQCRPTSEHVLALCADVGNGPAPRLTIRKLVPPAAHVVLDVDLTTSVSKNPSLRPEPEFKIDN